MSGKIEATIIKQFMDSRVQNQLTDFVHPPLHFENQLLYALQHGNHSLAHEMLAKINQLQAATLAPTTLRSKKNSLIALCTLFTRSIIAGGVQAELAFHLSDTYILEIEKGATLDQLNHLEQLMLNHFLQTVTDEQAKTPYSLLIKQTISYIHTHILKPLSLESIAEHVQVHPNYLSAKFKKEVGTPITDFIARKRIEESVYFLLQTDSSISDIALLFTFCNQSYYTAQFKKYMGMTPKEYREIHYRG